ncbi:NAD-dependent epimerase/dehydratase family protein [Pelagerythrobacter marensis]|uniref:Putative nucleoside-diphosphate-sugar epimerase n=1 Tax=Pelagerythrobacter marensis TaxID=543877 RepID=A0A0G3X872_9SPHN|nr:NAD-dependent epimerase/dehydratase family protein [Pelagerythrobacter marensis]AKM06538.1 putative nucleoside-diphosphate-sugar epimerase [Pelagerythrobacter marensis]
MLALTGGTGFVGQATLDAVARTGLTARALARKVPDGARPGIEWVGGSLSDRDALARLVDGAEAVIHIAGLTSTLVPTEFEAANVAGTLALIEAAKAAGVRRFVFVSSLAARRPDLSAYGASKARAEKVVAASGLDWTTVRPPAVYGPRDRDMFELFRAARRGVLPMPPAGRASMIHVTDLAELLLALVSGGERVSGAVFEPDDGQRNGWSHRDLALAIGAAVGRRPWVPHLPRGVLDWASRIDCAIRRGNARLTPDRVGYMCHPDWVADPDRAVPASVWQPRLPTREGLAATAQWYRDNGWL